MKIAVISANFGGIDDVLPIREQTRKFDRFVFDEKNTPVPLSTLDNRTKARYIKILPHRFLPGYDMYVWLDGRIQVTSNKFIHNYIAMLTGNDFAATLHYERDNIYDEIKFITHEMNKGNHYLIERYGHQQLKKELAFYYEQNVPKECPLLCSGMFARWNEANNNNMCEDWFMKCIEYTNFDQTMLTYMLHKWERNVNCIPAQNEFYKILKHIPKEPY